MHRLISFDIDGTLEAGRPPGLIPMDVARQARLLGWLIGSCSDRPVSAQRRMWDEHGIEVDFAVNKAQLGEVRLLHRADIYVHIGDTEVDRFYAERAGFAFFHVEDVAEHAWIVTLGALGRD
ncbi:MAG: hypothetical protein U0531_11965 [Dehalococcoidia bacterium]